MQRIAATTTELTISEGGGMRRRGQMCDGRRGSACGAARGSESHSVDLVGDYWALADGWRRGRVRDRRAAGCRLNGEAAGRNIGGAHQDETRVLCWPSTEEMTRKQTRRSSGICEKTEQAVVKNQRGECDVKLRPYVTAHGLATRRVRWTGWILELEGSAIVGWVSRSGAASVERRLGNCMVRWRAAADGGVWWW